MTSVRGETRSSRRSIFARLREMTQLMRENMQPKETQPETLDALRAKANIEAASRLVELNESRIDWVRHLQRHVDNTFRAIETLSVIAFAIGVVMIIVPFLVFFLSSTRDPNLLSRTADH